MNFLAWAFAQMARVISVCFKFFDDLSSRFGLSPVLVFLFFVGLMGTLFIRPIVGFGVNAVGADTVNAVYGKYKLDRDIKAAKRNDSIRFISRHS